MDSQYELMGLTLLYADTATIKNYCRTNTVARNICNSFDFWLEKFDYDNVPILNNIIKSGNDYMIEYIKVTEAQDKAQYLINIIDNYSFFHKTIIINIDMNHPNFINVFPIEQQFAVLEHKDKLINPTDVILYINMLDNRLEYHIIGVGEWDSLQFSNLLDLKGKIEDSFWFLTKMFYYYPNIRILNWKKEIIFGLK